MSNLFEKIGSVIATIGIAIGGFFGYVPEPQVAYVPDTVYTPEETQTETLGADTVLPIAGMTFYLSGTGISSNATSFILTSFTVTQNGKKIQDSELSDIFYVTFEPGSRTRQEVVSCTTVVQNADGTATISGCTRGLAPITPYTASTSLQFAHAGGSIAIFSNPPQLYNQMAIKDNDETITGYWDFPSPVGNNNPATKSYVLGVVTGGTISTNNTVVAGLAGETVATGTIVYLNASDSRWYKADNDLSSTYVDQTLGITQGPGTAGVSISNGVLTYGFDSTQKAMTGGQYIFLSGTAGATTTATTSQILGKAISATTMFFDQNLIDSSVYVPTTFVSTTTLGTTTIRGFEPVEIVHGVYVASTTGTSTFAVPAGIKKLKVEVVGGGGSGGSGSDEAGGGGGGGAGGYAMKYLDVSSTSTIVYYVGSNGEETRFGGGSGVFLRATAGSNGTQNAAAGQGGQGGVGSGGDINVGGGAGSTGGGGTALRGGGGSGGASHFGGGGAGANSQNNGGTSYVGQNYGAGGGGGSETAGSAGASGVIIITW